MPKRVEQTTTIYYSECCTSCDGDDALENGVSPITGRVRLEGTCQSCGDYSFFYDYNEIFKETA